MRTLAALLALACTIQAEEFAARVVSIADGDTLTVLRDTMQVRVRLDGIDAPERAQPYGTRARQFTGDLAHGQDVTVVIRDYDRYERTVAEIILPDGRNLNYEIVRAGFAWGYRHTRAATKRWSNWSAKHGKVASGLGRLCAGAAVGMAATEAVSSQVAALGTPVGEALAAISIDSAGRHDAGAPGDDGGAASSAGAALDPSSAGSSASIGVRCAGRSGAFSQSPR